MIDESDPAVRAMRAQFAQISALHKANVDKTVAEYHQAEAATKAHQQERARRETGTEPSTPPTAPEHPEQKNPWLTRKRPTSTEPDGTETGYYSGSFMQRH